MLAGELPGWGRTPGQGRWLLRLQRPRLLALSLSAIFSSCPSSPPQHGRSWQCPRLQPHEEDARAGIPQDGTDSALVTGWGGCPGQSCPTSGARFEL